MKISINKDIDFTYSEFKSKLGFAFKHIQVDKRDDAMKKEFERLTGKVVKKIEKRKKN